MESSSGLGTLKLRAIAKEGQEGQTNAADAALIRHPHPTILHFGRLRYKYSENLAKEDIWHLTDHTGG